MTVILLDCGNWKEINVLTSNLILLGNQLLDEIAYHHAIYFYKMKPISVEYGPGSGVVILKDADGGPLLAEVGQDLSLMCNYQVKEFSL